MRVVCLLAMVGLMLGCSPIGLMSEHPVEVVGPENHALVLDGLS